MTESLSGSVGMVRRSGRLGFARPTPLAAVHSNQLALFDVELLILIDHPFVKTARAEGLAASSFFERWLFKPDDITHQ